MSDRSKSWRIFASKKNEQEAELRILPCGTRVGMDGAEMGVGHVATLDYLEQEGLVNRIAQATFPPHVTYSLTSLAHNFLREISYVIEWGQQHYEEILQGRKTPHAR